jgi:protein SCO1
MLSGMLRVLVVALVVLVAVMFMLPRGARLAPPEAATLLPETRALPELTLTDEEGRELPTTALRGEFTLLFFGFTNCPDVCPLTLSMLAEARAKIAARAPAAVPRVLFVSVDPERDTPERIKAYVHAFDPSFTGATAPDATLEPWLHLLGVSVQKHEHGGEHYNVVHSAAIYFVGPAAEWIAVASGPHDPAVVATDYLKIRQRYGATHPTP